MVVIRALDISQPSPPDWWRRVRETRDVRLAIIRCWRGSGQWPVNDGFLANEASKASDAGIEMIAAYCWPPSQLGNAIRSINGVNRGTISFLAADQEAGARILVPEMMNYILDAGIDAWVYTSAGSWNTTMGDMAPAPWLKDYNLWLARYPYWAVETQWGERYEEWWPTSLAPEHGPEILTAGQRTHGGPFGARENIGPWNRLNPPLGWQHTGTCHIEGHDADLNIFDASVLESVTETESGMATLETIQARVDQVRWAQAVQQNLDQDATVLEAAAARIRGGRKLTSAEGNEVRRAVTRRETNGRT